MDLRIAGNVCGSWIFCQDVLLQFPSNVLLTTWWLCGYFPVRMLALLGQQRALGTYCKGKHKQGYTRRCVSYFQTGWGKLLNTPNFSFLNRITILFIHDILNQLCLHETAHSCALLTHSLPLAGSNKTLKEGLGHVTNASQFRFLPLNDIMFDFCNFYISNSELFCSIFWPILWPVLYHLW